ncbi:MAG: flagellar basal body rod protein FlgB [Myxococcota bacterium]
MAFTFDPLIGKLQTVLDLRMAQHALTASNLANADTPGYRAKMVDFSTVLDLVVDQEASPMLRSDPRHVAAGGVDPTEPPILEIDPAPWSLDGNSVLPERETARLQENALMYDAIARGLDHKLDLLRFVVSDGRA